MRNSHGSKVSDLDHGGTDNSAARFWKEAWGGASLPRAEGEYRGFIREGRESGDFADRTVDAPPSGYRGIEVIRASGDAARYRWESDGDERGGQYVQDRGVGNGFRTDVAADVVAINEGVAEVAAAGATGGLPGLVGLVTGHVGAELESRWCDYNGVDGTLKDVLVGGVGVIAGTAGAVSAEAGLARATNQVLRLPPRVNGNSRASTLAQHGYEIVDTMTGDVVKTGISGGRRTATGGSARANRQVGRWNRQAGQPGRYAARVVVEIPEGPGARALALEWEAANAARLRAAGQLNDPLKHTRP